MIRRVPIFLLGGKWRYIDGHLQWEVYLIHSTPILLDMDPKTFQRIGGGQPDPVQPLYLPLHVNLQIILIPPYMLTQPISVITELHHIVIILSSYCNWCLWYHVISYWYHPICRLNPSLSSPSCIILSSHHHHIVIILSSTSSCCTLYLPSQNYTILPYCNILDIL